MELNRKFFQNIIEINFKNLEEDQNYNQGKTFSGIINVSDSN